MGIPPSIPQAGSVRALRQNPLSFLEQARRTHGDIVMLTEDGPLFSRAAQCAGAIAVFGAENSRAVLSNIDTYGMPLSVAQRFSFPPKLVNLNFGLFSMTGSAHRERQQMLSGLLNAKSAERYHDAVAAACAAFLSSWQPGAILPLLSEMRRFALNVSDRMLFGSTQDELLEIGSLIQAYFQLRREYAAGRARDEEEALAALITLGEHLDRALRERLRRLREDSRPRAESVLALLSQLEYLPGQTLSEDELVAHGNVLFMSSSEPVAVALTWITLILTQLPVLRAQLRNELEGASLGQRVPRPSELDNLPLLDAVVREGLRLLPPSAILVRLSRHPSMLAGYSLPAWCEVVISPYVAHRDPVRFPQPHRFRPPRWKDLKPGPFEFFPFGAGGRYCLGRQLATNILKTGLAIMLQRHDIVLAGDQVLDWRMNVTMMPSSEPLIAALPALPGQRRGGMLQGAVAELMDLSAGSAP